MPSVFKCTHYNPATHLDLANKRSSKTCGATHPSPPTWEISYSFSEWTRGIWSWFFSIFPTSSTPRIFSECPLHNLQEDARIVVSHLRSKVKFPLVNHLPAPEHGICFTANLNQKPCRQCSCLRTQLTKLHCWRFCFWKCSDIAALCWNKKSLSGVISACPPRLFYQGTSEHARAGELNVHFLLWLAEIPWFHHPQPAAGLKGSAQEAEKKAFNESQTITATWGSTICFTLTYSNEFCK